MANRTWQGGTAGSEGDWATAGNWKEGAVPVAADDVIIANTSQSITDGLDQSAVALTSITIDQSFTGVIGSSSSDFLQIAASTATIGQKRASRGTFTGSKRLNLDFGSSTACQISIYNTASSSRDVNRDPLRIKAVNASTDIKVYGGTLAISDDSDNSSTIGDIEINNSGSVTIGESVTLSNVTQNGGTLNLYSSVATLANIKGGSFNHYDGTTASTIATLTISDGGIVNHNATGTITTCNLNGGTLDVTGTQGSKTITTLTADKDATFITDTATVTLTNDIALASSTKMQINFR